MGSLSYHAVAAITTARPIPSRASGAACAIVALVRLALLSLLFACGGASSASPSIRDTTSPDGDREAHVASGERLTDPVSSAIEDAIDARLGFPVRVVARVPIGDEMLVLYAMNGLTHWLAERPDRADLQARIEACESTHEEIDDHNCLDRTLRDSRDPEMLREYIAWCAPPRVPDVTEEEATAQCTEQFQNAVVFDVAAYCDRAFWSIARRTTAGWTVAEAGALPESCVSRTLALRTADLDSDGTPEVFVEAVSQDLDPMRLVNEGETRTLSIWRKRASAMERTFATELSDYAVDMGPREELRCSYALDGAPVSLRRECCYEPMADEDDEEASDGPRHPTEPSAACGPRFTEIYPSNGHGGFTRCRMVAVTGEERLSLRAEPAVEAEEAGEVHDGAPLEVVGGRAGWMQVIVHGGAAWIPEANATRRCD
jgi:hypothetical protein